MSTTATEPEGRLVTPLFALITASGLFYFISLGSLLPTLPRYVEEELSGSGFEVGLVVGAFAVSAAVVRPWAGRLGDVVGRRTMAFVGAAVAAVSILPLGVVHAIWFLIVVRLITGLGEAAFFIGAATAAQDLAPDHRRGEAASFFSIAIYGGLAFGPAGGEWIYRNLGADEMWIFSAAMAGISMVLAGFIPSDLGRADEPAARRGLLHPAAILPGSVLLLGLIGFTGFSAFVPLYVDDIGVDDAGPFFFAYGAIVLAVRIFGAKVPDRLGAVRTSTLALVSVAVGIGTVALVPSATGLWIGTVLLSIGMSLLFPALFILAVNNAPQAERSHAVGTFSLFFDLSQGLGAPALGVLVTVFDAERAAFVGGAVMALFGIVLANTKLRASIPKTTASSPR
jgi:MFS family permease